MNTNIHFWPYLSEIFFEWEIFQKNFVEKIKGPILCSIMVFFLNHAFYDTMWKNIVEPDWLQFIWCVYIACWIPKATNTLSEYVVIFCTAAILTRRRLSISYVHTLPVMFASGFCHSVDEFRSVYNSFKDLVLLCCLLGLASSRIHNYHPHGVPEMSSQQ